MGFRYYLGTMTDVKVVILAAGKGKRMGSDLPKALIPVAGKPILLRLLESVKASGIDPFPTIVVGHGHEQICEAFGGICHPVLQKEQLGTGHAVNVCREALASATHVLVLYGDHPCISAQTMQRLVDLHKQSGAVISMMTTTIPNFEGWYQVFLHWGRIIRDASGKLLHIQQYKDANEAERAITELDPALYCFRADWLWKNIDQITNRNAQGEYYLTDLPAIAVSQGHVIPSLSVPPEESVGMNTPEEKAVIEEILAR